MYQYAMFLGGMTVKKSNVIPFPALPTHVGQANTHSWRHYASIPVGILDDRIYVASREDETSAETPLQPMPTMPGHYPGFSIIAESISSSDTPDSAPAVDQPDHPPSLSFCCGLFTRTRKSSPGADSAPASVELCQLPASTSNATAPPLVASSQPMTSNILDVPALVQSPTATP
ncbi:hypothetical protein BU15DRAFT_79944 [Melanogaster broomeanus]|nr:hypothetical protein BU15DRAFT_79944 [Melanogaster broomeanus]